MKITKQLLCALIFSVGSSFSMQIPTKSSAGMQTEEQLTLLAFNVGLIAVGATYAYIKFEVLPKYQNYRTKKN